MIPVTSRQMTLAEFRGEFGMAIIKQLILHLLPVYFADDSRLKLFLFVLVSKHFNSVSQLITFNRNLSKSALIKIISYSTALRYT